MNAGAPTDQQLLRPLRDPYGDAHRALPELETMPGESVPEPYRSLLVHNRDMTRTLEAYHQGRIHLRVLSRRESEGLHLRTVVLELDGSNLPVEFGATRAYLDRFAEPWRSQILAGERPLGGILNASGIPYVSRPSAFFRTRADDFIRSALGVPNGLTLYGRRNTISNQLGEPLAEIIEILPPLAGG